MHALCAEHSDPDELARRADEIRTGTIVEELRATLEQQRARVQELRQIMDAEVSETQLIKVRVCVHAEGMLP